MNPRKQRELNDNLDFLRVQFDELNAGIKLPHSLDADMLRYKLENMDLKDTKPARKYGWIRPLAGAAACLVLVFGSVLALRGTQNSPSASPRAAQASNEEAAPYAAAAAPAGAPEGYARDYTEIRDAVFEMTGGMEAYQYDLGGESGAAAGAMDGDTRDFAPETAAAPASEKMIPNTAGGAAAYSGTNVQETGVDEADIVKTDGKYLYTYVQQNATTRAPTIFIADAAQMSLTSKIELDVEMAVSEFYISGDRLVTVGSGYEARALEALPREKIVAETDDSLLKKITKERRKAGIEADRAESSSEWGSAVVQAEVYDISDRANPEKVNSFLQDGNYTSSRMMDGVLYLVSERYVFPAFGEKNTPMFELVPAVYDGGQARLLPPDKIAVAPKASSPTYAVLSALDITSGKSDTQAVLGGSDGVYMSANSLYTYYTYYRQSTLGFLANQETGIVKLSVDGVDMRYAGAAMLPGYADGQFSFSEYKGNLRAALSVNYPNGESGSNVYVLGSDMVKRGTLKGLAPGERIYSVRYMDDMAYVVTFRETDPLFAIDLSDPENPKLLGQLKIPGFSEYLHPIDEHTLLGIGQSASNRGAVGGLKLSLFDVTDPLNPRELNVYNLGGQGSYSEALSNHKAVMFNLDRQMFGFPADLVDQTEYSLRQPYCVFRYDKDAGFTLEKAVELSDGDEFNSFGPVNRGLYIGDTLYAFAPDRIVSYDLDTFAQKQTLLLK